MTLYVSRFFYGSTQSHYLRHVLGLHVLSLGDFLAGSVGWSGWQGKRVFLLQLFLYASGVTLLEVYLYEYCPDRVGTGGRILVSGKVIEDNFLRFWIGLLVPVVLYLAVRLKRAPDKTSSFVEEFSEDGENPDSAKAEKAPPSFPLVSDTALAIPTVIVLFLLFLGVAPFLDAGPFSGTWAKLTGKLQSYSSARVAGATIGGSSGYTLNFLDVKSTIREAGSLDQKSKTINDIRMRNRILEDLPLWRGDWFNDDGSASPAKPADPNKKYKWWNPFEKTFNSMEQSLPKYAGDLNLKTALLALLGYLILCMRYWEFLFGSPVLVHRIQLLFSFCG